MNRAVFLDRDNTLIHNDGDLGDPNLVRLIQGVASAIASLRGLGYRIIVVSNQGGVARGRYTEADVQATNARVNELIVQTSGASIDRFYYCPYHPEGVVEQYRSEHPWRKPQPGMLLQAAKDLGLDMSQSWMVGDQLRDVQAGAAAGVRTVLLTPDASQAQPPLLQEKKAAQLLGKPGEVAQVLPDFVARNLIEAVRIIAQQRRPDGVEDWREQEPSAKTARSFPVALSPATARLTQSPLLPAVEPAPPSPAPAAASPAAAPAESQLFAPPVDPSEELQTSAVNTAPIEDDPAPAPPQPVPVSVPAVPTPPAVLAIPAIPSVTAGASISPAAAASTAPAPAAPPVDRPLPAGPAVETSLRQILQELRNQRHGTEDVGAGVYLAIAFQVIAVLCLLAALWLGQTRDAVFLRWFAVALITQLISISMLLFKR